MPSPIPTDRKRANITLWVIQGVLCVIFLFAGVAKLAMPMDKLAAASPLSPVFMKFIGVCEVLGAFGLILPGVLGIATYLTPLAAAGLTIIVIGATAVTVATMGMRQAILPFVVTVPSAIVAYQRWRAVPLRSRSEGLHLGGEAA